RPLEPAQHHLGAPGVAGAEHAHAHELALGRKHADDPGARRSVPAQIAFRIVLANDDAAVRADDRDRTVDTADERMTVLDPAVEHAHAHALPSGAAPCPLARHGLPP